MSEFLSVPRFSSNWSQALFERAWAHTVHNEYGRALGALHSLRAPYFEDEFYPEAKILQSIIYYYNCQWDRVNAIIDETKSEYEPMVKQLQGLSGGNSRSTSGTRSSRSRSRTRAPSSSRIASPGPSRRSEVQEDGSVPQGD